MKDSARPKQTKRGRQDDADAKALRELEAEFDEILPAQFPDQFSSLSDATLEPGETLALGGFRKANGSYEFTFLEITPIAADGRPHDSQGSLPVYAITMRTMEMSRGKSSQNGLDSLISPAKTRIQKIIVFPPGEIPQPDPNGGIMTMPSATVRPNSPAIMSVGTDDRAYVISLIVSPTDVANSIRIRTRVESPAEN